jgi:DNA-binding NarL/FixJ family response regulator
MNPGDVDETVRAAGCILNYQEKMGVLDLTPGDAAYELLNSVADPLRVSAFQSVYASVLALAARYEEAEAVSAELLETATRYRLDFAMPYALHIAAIAQAGLRRWSAAEASSRQSMKRARAGRDAYAEQLAFAVEVRVLLQQGKHQAALAIPVPSLRPALLSARAEVQCTRALALACAGRLQEAREVTRDHRHISQAVEPAVLNAAVDAVCALKEGAEDAIDAVATLGECALDTGAVDMLVTTYRSTPELLALLLRSPGNAERIRSLVRVVRDDDLASAVGFPVDADDPRRLLTPREREVFTLLRQGLTNGQIARALVIEESTVKVHARHIYDKLGVRSRLALRVQAALEREDQATSAIDVTGADTDS